jgi:hypothetical protein
MCSFWALLSLSLCFSIHKNTHELQLQLGCPVVWLSKEFRLCTFLFVAPKEPRSVQRLFISDLEEMSLEQAKTKGKTKTNANSEAGAEADASAAVCTHCEGV